LEPYLSSHFPIKALDILQYFLGIEVVWSKKGLFLSQRKYHTDLFDLLKEIFMLRIQTHYSNIRFDQHLGKPLVDPGQNTDWLVMVHLMVAQPNSPFLSVC